MYFYKIYPANKYADSAYVYSSKNLLQLNQLVEIEFGRKACFGVCVEQTNDKVNNVKPIVRVFRQSLSVKFVEFIQKCAAYNLATVGSILELALPNALLKDVATPLALNYEYQNKVISLNELQKQMRSKKINNLVPVYSTKLEFHGQCFTKEFEFTVDQEECSKKIGSLTGGTTLYLQGETGSGKTVVTLEGLRLLIEKIDSSYKHSANHSEKLSSEVCFDIGSKILIITPEVALGKMWADNIKQYCKINACFFNHKMNAQYKASVFEWAQSDEAGVIVGARSALFLPYKNLAAIVIDEEHSYSLKQDRYPYYNARDMAILRSRYENFPCILLSATVSLETFHNVNSGKFEKAEILRKSKSGRIELQVVKQTKFQILAPEIIAAINEKFQKGEQVLLFLNRKGYAPYCICVECSKILKCPGCDVPKIFYTNGKVVCHKCDSVQVLPTQCCYCKQNTTWRFFGVGVEKLMEYVDETFPKRKFKVVTSQTKEIDEYIDDLNDKKIDGLIATQVLAQGHDFRGVTLVVIVDADMGLNSPDFRSKERMLQLWKQVSGRSGRHSADGKIIIQTSDENSKFIDLFKDEKAYKTLMLEREQAHLPPFTRCGFISLKSKNHQLLRELCSGDYFQNLKLRNDLEVYGPLYIGKERYVVEYRFLLKVSKKYRINEIMSEIMEQVKKVKPKSVIVEFEVDPYRFD